MTNKKNQMLFDFYKHITTLSSAALVILAAFIREFTAISGNPEAILLLVTLWCFVITIIGSVENMVRIAKDKEPRKGWHAVTDVGFVFGMIFLVISSMTNLFP